MLDIVILIDCILFSSLRIWHTTGLWFLLFLMKNLLLILLFLPYTLWVIFLLMLSRFLLSLWLSIVLQWCVYMCISVYFEFWNCWVSWMCSLTFFIKFGKFGLLFPKKIFCLFLSLLPLHIHIPDIVCWDSEALFIFFNFFPLCFSGWIISKYFLHVYWFFFCYFKFDVEFFQWFIFSFQLLCSSTPQFNFDFFIIYIS